MKPIFILLAIALPACHRTPLADLRDAFNREQARTRVVALLSPT
jgi:hypothetical protein